MVDLNEILEVLDDPALKAFFNEDQLEYLIDLVVEEQQLTFKEIVI